MTPQYPYRLLHDTTAAVAKSETNDWNSNLSFCILQIMHATPESAPQSALISRAEDFIRNSPGFFCGYGRAAFLEGRLPITCLPKYRLEGAGKSAPHFQGEVARVWNMAELQQMLRRALVDYKRAGADGMVLVDPQPLRERDHETAFNRTWALYAQLGVACLRLFPPPEESELAARLTDEQILDAAVLDIASELSSPEHFSRFRDEGQLFDGQSSLHFFAMNPLYPETFPRWAPLNLMVVTNLDRVAAALQKSPGPAHKMTRAYSDRTERPYNGDLPYVIPNNPAFDPPLLTELINLVWVERRKFDNIPPGREEEACIRSYHVLQAKYKERGIRVEAREVILQLQSLRLRDPQGPIG